MTIEKKLDALIDALGFDVERVRIGDARCDCYKSNPLSSDHLIGCQRCQGTGVSHGIFDYKLTKRKVNGKSELHRIVREYESGHRSIGDMLNEIAKIEGMLKHL
jgi:hypothetical protein